MKNSKKLKIWGFSLLTIGLLLIILGSTVFRDKKWDHFTWKPHFGLFVPGLFLTFFSLPIIISGFNPEIVKFGSKLQSETIDYAGQDMKDALSKSADTIVPAITPSIKTAVSELKGNKETTDKPSKAAELTEAKQLLDDNLISEEEYTQMRKNILGINK